MAAPKGNQFWRLGEQKGRPLAFDSPEDLWEKACEYFEWCEANPLKEEKLFHHQGVITKGTTNKLRAFTLKELCLFLGVNEVYFNQFNEEDNEDFSKIITRIRDVIYTQKFTGAAADLLNPNIIARQLGIKEQSDITTNGNEINTSIPLVLQDGRTYDDLKKDLTPE